MVTTPVGLYPPVPASEYAERRRRFLQVLGQGVAILPSAPLAYLHNDVEATYRQDGNLFYLTGLNEPGAVAVFAPHHPEHQFILFVQPKDWEKEVWTGYRVGPEAAKELYGCDVAFSLEELDQKLPEYVEGADCLYYHPGRDEDMNRRVYRLWQKMLHLRQRKGYGPTMLADVHPLLHPLRMVKSPLEIERIKQAVAIAVQAHQYAQDIVRPGMYEYELQAAIERVFQEQGGRPAYPSIVASGPNACILHYGDNTRQMQAGDLVLVDAGCAWGCYNSDITRTFPVNGQMTPPQKAIYEVVLRAQQAAIGVVKPGVPYDQVHKTAVRVLVEGLLDLGLLQGDPEAIANETDEKKQAYRPYYMHRTGHWLGLDVHDAGIYYQAKEQATLLAPGQVFTVEPGLYIGPHTQPVEGQPPIPDEFRGIGVRIEDDVLVTETGCEVLTAAVPK
ncbi:MAG: aminopeptidase P N-terminal domain-containing protein [Gloeomargarita sp. GMQP_bins_44]